MLGFIASGAQIWLDQQDQGAYRERLKQSVFSLEQRLDITQPDWVAMGYSSQWQEVAAQHLSPGKAELRVSAEASGDLGLTAQKVVIVDPVTNVEHQGLVLGSGRTLWGDLTSFLAEDLLESNPSKIYFFGSAGLLSKDARVYDISIPREFRTADGTIPLTNSLQQDAVTESLPASSHLITNMIHGNTNSPMAESAAFIRDQLSTKVGTLDVEQSLVAESVFMYNREHHTNIQFGAANILTDAPGHVVWDQTTPYDLDRVDSATKSRLRQSIIEIGISDILSNATIRCDRVLEH
jgi:hypothetical protein